LFSMSRRGARHVASNVSNKNTQNRILTNNINNNNVSHNNLNATRFQRMIVAPWRRISSRRFGNTCVVEQEVVVIVHEKNVHGTQRKTRTFSLTQKIPQHTTNDLLCDEQYAVFH
jgi:hypothetical protein